MKGQIGQNKRKGVTINNDLNIYTESKILEPRKLKLKLIQNILLDRNFEKKFQLKWNTVFNKKSSMETNMAIISRNPSKQQGKTISVESNSQYNFHRA